jgi:putative endonuclease
MVYTYILRCSDSSYYTGSTRNLDQRLWQHQNGQGANHTKIRLPVKLMYVEYYERIDEAFAREKQIQKWSRKKKEALIEGNFKKLRCLSKSHFDRLSDHTSDRLSDHTSERLSSKYDEGRCLSLSNGRCLSLSKAEL